MVKWRVAGTEYAEDVTPQDEASLSAASETVWHTPPMTAHQRRMTVSTRSMTEMALAKIANDLSEPVARRAAAQAELDRR